VNRTENPFTPGAGSPPPALLGRDELLDDAEILLVRTKRGRSEKSMIMTGLRGVGKTVLLNRIDALARHHGYHSLFIEVSESGVFLNSLVQHIKRILGHISMKGGGGTVKKALSVLKSFTKIRVGFGDFSVGMDVEPVFGMADSGELETDLTDLFVVVGETSIEKGTGIALLIDEIQFLKKEELAALILALHKMQQLQLPVVLVGAGLPVMYELSGNAKSYAERLFQFPEIGPLDREQSLNAIRIPFEDAGETITDDALSAIFDVTRGYPYFVQEWGYQVWNMAESSPVGIETVNIATPAARHRLDENFFQVRFNRLSQTEKHVLRAMASLGPGPHKSSDIAAAMGKNVTKMSRTRSQLIDKGMIFSPRYGSDRM